MAHARGHSQSISSAPHSVSLKVLRLSRPSLTVQHPLPQSTRADADDDSDSDDLSLAISPSAGLAVPGPANAPSARQQQQPLPEFTLTPALTLPSSFASAYVGENFACLLSANNELADRAGGKDEAGGAQSDRRVSAIRITAEMQTPSNPAGAALQLEHGGGTADAEEGTEGGAAGEGVQRIVRLDLKEEGNHILAVTVTYTESQAPGREGGDGEAGPGLGATQAAAGARSRTFRKLYQFVAQQLLSVRTKTGTVGTDGGGGAARYVLEAQLENMGQAAVCLEEVELNPRAPFTSTSLNWDMAELKNEVRAPVLSPRDVMQVAFLLQQDAASKKREKGPEDAEATRLAEQQQRTVLGQLSIRWRGHMGDRGSLSTGWLSAKAS